MTWSDPSGFTLDRGLCVMGRSHPGMDDVRGDLPEYARLYDYRSVPEHHFGRSRPTKPRIDLGGSQFTEQPDGGSGPHVRCTAVGDGFPSTPRRLAHRRSLLFLRSSPSRIADPGVFSLPKRARTQCAFRGVVE